MAESVDVMAQVEEILGAEVDSVMDSRESQRDEKTSDTQKPDNYEYRLKAAQRQQQKATQQIADLGSKLDQVLTKLSGDSASESSSDPIMKDVKQLQTDIARLTKEREQEQFKNRDRAFFQNHPDLNPMQISEELTSFLTDRKTLAIALVKGEIDIEDVYVQYAHRQGNQKESKVQNSDQVFGGIKSEASPRRSNQSVSRLQKAYDSLDNPHSTDKHEAVHTLETEIMKEIQSQLY